MWHTDNIIQYSGKGCSYCKNAPAAVDQDKPLILPCDANCQSIVEGS